MTLIGDTKEEDREIFAAMKELAQNRRRVRAAVASEHLDAVKLLVDNGQVAIDPNGTWNMRIKQVSCQYWPTKGRWQYVCPKMVARAKAKALKRGKSEYTYYTSNTQFGGGIHKFIQWLQRQQ